MARITENALRICEASGWNPSEAPWYVGLISLEPPSEAALERGRQLAAKYGWLNENEPWTRTDSNGVIGDNPGVVLGPRDPTQRD